MAQRPMPPICRVRTLPSMPILISTLPRPGSAEYRRCREGAHPPPSASWHETVAHDVDEGCQAIPPADLLPLGVGSPVVGNGHLINPASQLRHLHRNLRLEAKAARLDRDPFQHLGPKHLITDFHVREIQIGHHITEGGQYMVTDSMPEIEHAV